MKKKPIPSEANEVSELEFTQQSSTSNIHHKNILTNFYPRASNIVCSFSHSLFSLLTDFSSVREQSTSPKQHTVINLFIIILFFAACEWTRFDERDQLILLYFENVENVVELCSESLRFYQIKWA